MLTIYDKIPKDMEYIHDVEEAFNYVRVSDSTVVRDILKYIECAEYLDDRYVIDRFGAKLSIKNISTGCKAALLTHIKSNACVNTAECGINARDAIINFVPHGNILMEWNEIDINDTGKIVECRVDNYIFSYIHRINRYFSSERPFQADLRFGGVREYVQA